MDVNDGFELMILVVVFELFDEILEMVEIVIEMFDDVVLFYFEGNVEKVCVMW